MLISIFNKLFYLWLTMPFTIGIPTNYSFAGFTSIGILFSNNFDKNIFKDTCIINVN